MALRAAYKNSKTRQRNPNVLSIPLNKQYSDIIRRNLNRRLSRCLTATSWNAFKFNWNVGRNKSKGIIFICVRETNGSQLELFQLHILCYETFSYWNKNKLCKKFTLVKTCAALISLNIDEDRPGSGTKILKRLKVKITIFSWAPVIDVWDQIRART